MKELVVSNSTVIARKPTNKSDPQNNVGTRFPSPMLTSKSANSGAHKSKLTK